MQTVLIVFHVLMAIAMMALILLQRGPGATMGAAFGSGASGTVFGSRGAASFLTRGTAALAIGFFTISLTLAVLAARGPAVVDDLGVVGAERPAPVEMQIPEMPALEVPTAADSMETEPAEATATETDDEFPLIPDEEPETPDQ